jgi:hypothetical protein
MIVDTAMSMAKERGLLKDVVRGRTHIGPGYA